MAALTLLGGRHRSLARHLLGPADLDRWKIAGDVGRRDASFLCVSCRLKYSIRTALLVVDYILPRTAPLGTCRLLAALAKGQ